MSKHVPQIKLNVLIRFILFLCTAAISAPHRSTKIILYWNKKNNWKDWGWDFGFGMKCGNRCLCTDDRKMLPIADAVLFTPWNFTDLPKRNNPKQIFVIALYETPERSGSASSDKKN